MTTTTDALWAVSPPAIPGLQVRAFQGPADYAGMAEVFKAISLTDGIDFIPDAASMQVEHENDTDHDPREDVLIFDVDGRVVAFASAGRELRDGLAVYSIGGGVHPEWRRRGLGRAIVRATEHRLRQKAAGFDDPEGRAYGTWIAVKEAGVKELFASEGYTPVRWSMAMRRPSLDDLPEVALPDGLEIRDVREEDLRRIFDADNEAFRDHWGHREATDEDFERLRKMPDLDTALWSVAWDGDEVAGSVQAYIWRSENEALGVKRGWLEHISVRRPWRGRGLASALMADAMRRLRERGMESAMLGVDTDNPSGAVRLYERLGFREWDRGAGYRKPWEPGGRIV